MEKLQYEAKAYTETFEAVNRLREECPKAFELLQVLTQSKRSKANANLIKEIAQPHILELEFTQRFIELLEEGDTHDKYQHPAPQ
jgi:hypothetical protein